MAGNSTFAGRATNMSKSQKRWRLGEQSRLLIIALAHKTCLRTKPLVFVAPRWIPAVRMTRIMKKNDTKDMPSLAIATGYAEDEASDGSSCSAKKVSKIEMRKDPSSMARFFHHVDTIQSDIEAVKNSTAQIASLREDAVRATTTEEENAISKKLNLIVGQTSKCAKSAKDTLCRLEQDTKNLKKVSKLTPRDER